MKTIFKKKTIASDGILIDDTLRTIQQFQWWHKAIMKKLCGNRIFDSDTALLAYYSSIVELSDNALTELTARDLDKYIGDVKAEAFRKMIEEVNQEVR